MPTHPYANRRTFAIISHPDAGKTTLTEKLLLYGGAVQMAGEVKARKTGRYAKSDWMDIEKKRGISVTASVMTFDYDGKTVNLLDTPGHEDFSEDTYRTLTAVDSAVMVLDAAKGIEPQTRKLFEVCRLRDTPVITFINKMDREAEDSFALIDQISDQLALDIAPMTWPVGCGERFRGVYHIAEQRLYLFSTVEIGQKPENIAFQDVHDPALEEHLPATELEQLREEIEMVQGLCPAFDEEAYREGHLSPVYFGSALHNFGVLELLQGVLSYAPSPRPQPADPEAVRPEADAFSAFIFKIQANMDARHRDRIAFARICSGTYRRGMKATHVRTGKQLSLNNPVLFLAQDREVAEEAYPGDIIGIPNHGNLHIGDALTEGKAIHFTGIPSFAPEIFRRPMVNDPLRAKHLKKALQELSEEGVSQLFKPVSGSPWIIGVVGQLQLDVMQSRLKNEYQLDVRFEDVPYTGARWIANELDEETLLSLRTQHLANLAEDGAGVMTFLSPNDWHIERIQQDWPDVCFAKTREIAAS